MHDPRSHPFRPRSRAYPPRPASPAPGAVGSRPAGASARPRGTRTARPFPLDLVAELTRAARHEFTAGRPESASQCLRLINRVGASPARGWRHLGDWYFRHGDFESAGRALGRAAAHRPADATLQASLARVCLRLQDVPSFEGYLARALALDPRNLLALELLAEVARDHGDPAIAAEIYTRLLALRPRDPRFRAALAVCQTRLLARMTVLNLLRRNRMEASAAPSNPLPGSMLGNLGCAHVRPAPARGDADLPEL